MYDDREGGEQHVGSMTEMVLGGCADAAGNMTKFLIKVQLIKWQNYGLNKMFFKKTADVPKKILRVNLPVFSCCVHSHIFATCYLFEDRHE